MRFPPPKEVVNFLEVLLVMTQKGVAQWSIDEYGILFHQTPKAGISIRSRDDDEMFPYIVTFLDGEGNAVDSFTTPTPGLRLNVPDNGPEVVVLLGNLFLAAKTRSLDIGGLIEAMVNDFKMKSDDEAQPQP